MLQAVIESSEGPIFSVNGDLRYTSFNSRHADVMKTLYGANIQVGRNILDYHTNPADRMSARQNLDRGLRGESFTSRRSPARRLARAVISKSRITRFETRITRSSELPSTRVISPSVSG